jgi:hypothetical protein
VSIKITYEKAVEQGGFLKITSEEFVELLSDGNYFFNREGDRGFIHTVNVEKKEITFCIETSRIPNPIRRVEKNSDFFLVNRIWETILIAIEQRSRNAQINTFIIKK